MQIIFSKTLLIFFLLISYGANAATLQAAINKNNVIMNEVISLSIMADVELDSDALNFSVLQTNFAMGQPRYSRSIKTINGQRSVEVRWQLDLVPIKTGQIVIPSFSVVSRGLKTQPIKLNVATNTTVPDIDEVVTMDVQLSNNMLYPYQSSDLKVIFLLKSELRNFNNIQISPPISPDPTLKIAALDQLHQIPMIMGGLQVTAIEQTFRITPESNLDLTSNKSVTLIPPKMTGTFLYRHNGIMQGVPINLTGKLQDFILKPLPKDYKGEWFPALNVKLSQTWTDAKGNELSTDVIPTINAGSAITRTITMHVYGSLLEYLPRIQNNYPEQIRAYQEQPQFQTQEDASIIMTVKEVLIPIFDQEHNTVILPSYALNWWNSKQDRNMVAKLDMLTIKVKENSSDLVVVTDPSLNNISPVVNTKINSNENSILWIITTAIFACLWVSTLAVAIYLWRTKTITQNIVKQEVEIVTIKQMLAKIKHTTNTSSLDPITLESQVAQLLTLLEPQVKNYNKTIIKQIKQELAQMNLNYFGKVKMDNLTIWQPKRLLSLLDEISNAKNMKIKTDDSLPEL